ncbi:GNAT family N-acetyltransferase [Angustibacter sp. McL0619]|uniref:GNAT family N-acetyltransferase n=1 Tax=Angustibacter sp. McL0619 TaxID=3415676 RepID=UPI003CEF9E2F
MRARPATLDDVPAILALQRRWDTHWFGAPENDESEVRQSLNRVEPLAGHSLLLLDDAGELVGASWWWSGDTRLIVDPAHAGDPASLDVLLPWLRAGGVRALESLATDQVQESALVRHGWRYEMSAYELIRQVTPDWVLAAPDWPDGVRTSDLRPDDAPDVHDLIYRRAGWASVPGHSERDLAEWQGLFLDDEAPLDQQVLAWDGETLVGAALGHTFSDGAGWVSQLAVAQDQRGRGLGRALLLESLHRRVSTGATALGLSVSALNPDALRLYLEVGLVVDREWRTYLPT